MMPGAGGDVNTTLPLLLNVFALVFCGATLISAPLSIIGIVFALQARSLEGRGDILGARGKAKISTRLFFGSLAIGVMLLVLWQWLTR